MHYLLAKLGFLANQIVDKSLRKFAAAIKWTRFSSSFGIALYFSKRKYKSNIHRVKNIANQSVKISGSYNTLVLLVIFCNVWT